MTKKKKTERKKDSGKKNAHKRKKQEEPEAAGRRQKRYRNNRHLLIFSVEAQLEHGKQVSNLAYEVAKELKLPEEKCENLAVAGFLHDIGKAELNQAFQQEDPLVVEEMNSVRMHPMKGYEILKRHGFDEEICEDVLFHHENYDGSGYPDNLAGPNIPVGACILRVCDVFCALVSDRAYRKAYSPEKAMELMTEDMKDFDLRVFLAFQRVMHQSEDGSLKLPEVSENVKGVWKSL